MKDQDVREKLLVVFDGGAHWTQGTMRHGDTYCLVGGVRKITKNPFRRARIYRRLWEAIQAMPRYGYNRLSSPYSVSDATRHGLFPTMWRCVWFNDANQYWNVEKAIRAAFPEPTEPNWVRKDGEWVRNPKAMRIGEEQEVEEGVPLPGPQVPIEEPAPTPAPSEPVPVPEKVPEKPKEPVPA